MSAAGSLLLTAGLIANLVGVSLMLSGARWLGRQRRLGYPDPRARTIDRPRVLVALAFAYIWANVIILTVVSVAAARI